MEQDKKIEQMCNRMKRLKEKYFKIIKILNDMWDDMYYLHEDISKLKKEKKKHE